MLRDTYNFIIGIVLIYYHLLRIRLGFLYSRYIAQCSLLLYAGLVWKTVRSTDMIYLFKHYHYYIIIMSAKYASQSKILNALEFEM